MSSLKEILRTLKKKKEEGISSTDLHFVTKKVEKEKSYKNIFITIAIFFLFFASIIGGFFLVKILSTFKERKDLAKLAPPREMPKKVQEAPLPPNININTTDAHISVETPKKKEVNEEKRLETKKEEEKRGTHFSEKKESSKKNFKEQRVQKHAYLHKPVYKDIKKPQPKEELSLTPKGGPEEKMPLLRDKKLLENLLLNAEEARAKGNIDEAIGYYTAYLKHKEDPDVLNNLAGLYMLKGDFKRAERLLERALSLKQDKIFEINLIICLWKLGEKERACQYLKERHFYSPMSGILEELKKQCK